MAILEYINQWNTELVYLLFLMVTLLVFLVFQLQNAENTPMLEVFGATITVFHIITALLIANLILLLWNQLKRKNLEEAVREIIYK